MRPIWKGGISFGLVYIPVKLYSAIEPVQIDLDFISKKDKSPIRYARIDTKTGKEVAWKDIVKGFEFSKGDYVILEDEDFEKAAKKKSKTINIESFVQLDKIDDIYFEKPYYLEPEEAGEKTYSLLVSALEKSGKVGIAEFVFKNREHLCMLKPRGNMLILHQMRYLDEIRSAKDLNIPKDSSFSRIELETALELINKMSDEFEAKDYKDDYIEELEKLIKAKIKNKPIKIEKAEEHKTTEISDILEQLKESLRQ